MLQQKKENVKQMDKIYLGLDIGTNSCGWALTDEKYNLKKINGKDAWGVRLFDEAKTKADRRLNRTNKRRMVRKKLQNMWLQELFKDEVQKVDDNFFSRLKYSNLWKEDKALMDEGLTSKYSLFNDVLENVYNDRNYYQKYITVYHLREELLTKSADDIRLLYLAVHSILTHRGHFLSGAGLDDVSDNENDLLKIIQELFCRLNELSEDEPFLLKCNDLKFIDNLLSNFENLKSIREIKEKLVQDMGAKTKLEKEIASIFVSGKSSTNKLFERIGKEDKIDFEFDSDKFEDETYGKLASNLNEDEIRVIDLLKTVFSSIQLKRVLGDDSYICQAMVKKYEKHNSQLNEFKEFVRKYYPSKKNLFFKQMKSKSAKGNLGDVCNYAKYINSDLENKKKRYFDKTATQEEFYKFVKSQLETNEVECECNRQEFEKERQYFLDLIDKNDFLLKIRARENAVIPNALYVKELKQILNVSTQKFAFLSDRQEDGLSVIDKIVSIIEFRVPYFVGPIGTNGEKRINGWAEKECDLELRPWTLNKIVNYDKAEDMFIQRMTNKCTYLPEEDVLPKDSLVYSKFRVLNELNNLKINGNSIFVELKQEIFDKLFKNYKKISMKKLKEFLVAENVVFKEDINNVNITGIDREFANSYSTFVTLKERFGEDFVNLHEEDFETIIKYHTIISDKSRLEKRIEREFEYFSKEDIKFLKSLNYSKWGRLSKKFLTGLQFADKKTGEVFNVLSGLWSTNNNLMELMGSGFTLSENLSMQRKKQTNDLIYQDVEELYCSPAVKRGAWQAIQIINELKKSTGKYPDKIFVEVTREDSTKGDAGRKDARYKALTKLYGNKDFKKHCEGLAVEYNKLMQELNKVTNANVRSDRLYLYFLQLGKCMYTGESIEISDIYNENLYDIDHIIPQSKIKDDSLNNKVLVKKDANRSKGDVYPIIEVRPDWVQKQKYFWQFLESMGFISSDKLARLLRVEPFTDKDANDFVNRQLVITNQETKAVIDLLKRVIDNPNDIVFSKAKFVSGFRNKYDVYKSRNVNDLHHAKDAYLNIVVGDVLKNRFTEGFWKRDKEDFNRGVTANITRLFDGVIRSNRDGLVVWSGIEDVKKTVNICNKNTCSVSFMPYTNSNGMFYNETNYKSLNKNPNSEASVPLKGDDNNPLSSIEKYGGYNSMKGAYFMVVESQDKKGKTKKTIESVPILISYKYRNDENKNQKIIEYIEKENNIKITKIILDKLKYNSLLKIGGGLYRLTGKTNDNYKLLKATQWHIDNSWVGYIKIIEKYLALDASVREKLEEAQDKIVVSPAVKENQKELAISRVKNEQLYDLIILQLSKSLYDISSIKGVLEKVKNGKEMFTNLSIKDQIILLNGLVQYVGGMYTVDLKLIGGAGMSGGTSIGKDITDKNISLVCQSISGIYQKEIKL